MRVPLCTAHAELVVKRSRFLSRAERFADPESIKETIRTIREKHPGCNHVVYGYVVGPAGSLFGMSDDREPKGTAGRPVLEVLKGSGLTNVLVTVVRYFGGTKLGTGGLVRAYTEAAQNVLAALDTEELVEKSRFSVSIPYPLYEACRRLIESAAGTIEKEEFATQVLVHGELPESRKEELATGLADLSAGRVTLNFPDRP
ncbi:MAG: YigZ family protein [Spirochaetales bacterium]|nr:YigZ family protein [Spirochaetales bacterium]